MLQSTTHESPQNNLTWWYWLIGITAAGFLIRAVNLNSQSFFYDEVVTAREAQSSFRALASGIVRDNGNPPFFWILAKAAAALFGLSETTLRGLALLAGTAALPLFGLLGRRLFGGRAGLIAAALLAASPFSLEFSTEARVYPVVQLMAIAATLLFLSWLEGKGLTALIPYVLLTALGCWSHYYFAFVPLAHGAAVIATRDGRRCLHWCAAMLVSALLYAFWLPVLLSQIRTPGNLARGGEKWLVQFLATPVAFTLGRSFAWKSASHGLLAFTMLAALLVFWLPALYALLRSKLARPYRILLGAWLVLPVAIPLIIAVLKAPLYSARYGAIGMPALLLLVSAFLAELPPRRAIAMGVCIITLCGISIVRFGYVPIKDDWRRATAWLQPRLSPDGIVVVEPDEHAVTYLYHSRNIAQAPIDVLAVSSDSPLGGPIAAFLYHSGVRMDRVPMHHDSELYGHKKIWLLRLASARPLDSYADLFRKHGFVRTGSAEFYGIDLAEFRTAVP